MEFANPIHPFTAMLISRSKGTCLIGFSFNFICIAEGKAKIDGMFLFGKTKRIERVPEGNHFLCRPKTAPTSDVDQAASPITHCTHTGSLSLPIHSVVRSPRSLSPLRIASVVVTPRLFRVDLLPLSKDTDAARVGKSSRKYGISL